MRYLLPIIILASLPLYAGTLNQSHHTPQKDWHVRWHNCNASDKDFCSDAQAMKIANATDSPRGFFTDPDDPDGVVNAFEAMGFPEPHIGGRDVKIDWWNNEREDGEKLLPAPVFFAFDTIPRGLNHHYSPIYEQRLPMKSSTMCNMLMFGTYFGFRSSAGYWSKEQRRQWPIACLSGTISRIRC